MSEFPAGVPCWVETLQPDPAAALEFYGPLFGWEFSEPGPGQYFVARIGGRDVAGIGSLQGLAIPSWNTYIRVSGVEATVERALAAGGTLLFGPLEAPPAGRLAVLGDPAGVAFCLWEAGARAGAQLVNEPNTWTMSSLHTPDPAGANAFYGELFGWQPEPFGPVTVWRRPGYVGGREDQPIPRDVVAVMTPTDRDVPPHWNVNFRVADADAFAEQAAGLGGTVMMPPTDAPGFRNAVLGDPQGAVFSVSQHVA